MPTVKEIPIPLDKRKIKKTQQVKEHGTNAVDRDNAEERYRKKRILFASLLFCSGAAALAYQILWIKQLSIIVGVEVYSIAAAVSAFFLGLALGGLVIGRWADRSKNSLRLYFLIETVVAMLGIATTFSLGHTALLFSAVEAHVGVLAWVLPFLMVGVPAFFMGGTLPIATRASFIGNKGAASIGGVLYAINTAGGIAGILACASIFLPHFGVMGTGVSAATLNLIAAAIALNMSCIPQDTKDTFLVSQQTHLSRQQKIAMVLYSLAGAIALGYELVWSQAIVQFITTRSFAFSIVLTTYLTGLALGSAVYARYADKVRNPWELFGFLIAAAGLSALLEITFLGFWQLQIQASVGDVVFSVFGSQFARMCAKFIVAAVGIVFVPTMLLGAAFPAVLQLIVGQHRVGRDMGAVIGLNTAGGIAGTLSTGFVLVPRFGLVRTLSLLAMVACVVGITAVFYGSRGNDKRMRWMAIAVGVATVVACTLTPTDRLARLLVLTRGGGKLMSYEESKAGTVAVVQQSVGMNMFHRLYIQGVSNSGDAMPSLRYMRLQALLPLIIHSGPSHSALVIGFGTGITAGALLEDPELNRRVCAELLPAVVKAGTFFRGNYGASQSSELQIRIRDGRRELMRNADRYDLITLEPPPPSAAGVVNLYSQDFYKLAAGRLESKGLFAQWLPLTTQNDEDTRSLVRSFLDVFPYATLWTTELHEMLLIGSLAPIELNGDRISQRFEQPSVNAALKEVGISSPEALLATWVTGREGLERYADGIRPVTDDYPSIEYSPWVHTNEILLVLPELIALRSEPPVIAGSQILLSRIFTQRQTLMMFYAAGLDAYRGDRQSWARDIRDALKEDPNNPYYRWVVGQT